MKVGAKTSAFLLAFPNIITMFAMPNSYTHCVSVEHPDRCSIRNWAFFMSIGLHFRELMKMIPYTKFTAVFSHILMLFGCSV